MQEAGAYPSMRSTISMVRAERCAMVPNLSPDTSLSTSSHGWMKTQRQTLRSVSKGYQGNIFLTTRLWHHTALLMLHCLPSLPVTWLLLMSTVRLHGYDLMWKCRSEGLIIVLVARNESWNLTKHKWWFYVHLQKWIESCVRFKPLVFIMAATFWKCVARRPTVNLQYVVCYWLEKHNVLEYSTATFAVNL